MYSQDIFSSEKWTSTQTEKIIEIIPKTLDDNDLTIDDRIAIIQKMIVLHHINTPSSHFFSVRSKYVPASIIAAEDEDNSLNTREITKENTDVNNLDLPNNLSDTRFEQAVTSVQSECTNESFNNYDEDNSLNTREITKENTDVNNLDLPKNLPDTRFEQAVTSVQSECTNESSNNYKAIIIIITGIACASISLFIFLKRKSYFDKEWSACVTMAGNNLSARDLWYNRSPTSPGHKYLCENIFYLSLPFFGCLIAHKLTTFTSSTISKITIKTSSENTDIDTSNILRKSAEINNLDTSENQENINLSEPAAVSSKTSPEHHQLILEREKIKKELSKYINPEGERDIITQEDISKEQLQSSQVINFPKYVLYAKDAVKLLLENETTDFNDLFNCPLNPNERKEIIQQITQIFQISEDDWQSCFKADSHDMYTINHLTYEDDPRVVDEWGNLTSAFKDKIHYSENAEEDLINDYNNLYYNHHKREKRKDLLFTSCYADELRKEDRAKLRIERFEHLTDISLSED